MPFTIPNIRISPEQCFLHTQPELYRDLIDIIDIFEHMSTEAQRDLPKSWIDRYVSEGEYNIYLTGGRAFHLVLNALKPELKGLFWDILDWNLLEKIYAGNCDYDIQCCWKNKVMIKRFDQVMLRSFDAMKHRIEANHAAESHDTLTCSNGIIDISWIQQPSSRIDIMNTAFRINLISGEVECLTEAGFKLLINEHQIDVPHIMHYIQQPKQNRALSKMTFTERNMAKAFALNFMLSPHTKEALEFATRKRAYAKKLQIYNDEKFADLRKKFDENKMVHMDALAGIRTQLWLERILFQHRKNTQILMPSLSHIPAASTSDILINIKLIIGINRQPRDQSEAIELYLRDTLEYYMAPTKLQDLIKALEALPSDENIYAKGLALCNKAYEKMLPKSLVQKKSNVQPTPTVQPSETTKDKTDNSTKTPLITSPSYKRFPNKQTLSLEQTTIQYIQAKLKPETLKKIENNHNDEYGIAYMNASDNFDALMARREFYPRSGLTNRGHFIANEVCKVLRTDPRIKFPTDFQKRTVGSVFGILSLIPLAGLYNYYVTPENSDAMYNWKVIFNVTTFIFAYKTGLYRASTIGEDMMNRCGLDHFMITLSYSLDVHKEKPDKNTHYTILCALGLCVIYGLEFYDENSTQMIRESGNLFLEDPMLAAGIAKVMDCSYSDHWNETPIYVRISNMLKALATLDVKDLLLVLTYPIFSITGITPEEIQKDLERDLPFIRTLAEPMKPANHNVAQYATKHPRPNPRK